LGVEKRRVGAEKEKKRRRRKKKERERRRGRGMARGRGVNWRNWLKSRGAVMVNGLQRRG
jgi:hypothetical protein